MKPFAEGGHSSPSGLGQVVERLLPTPRASTGGTDFARAGREESGGDDLGTKLVKMALLPTPSAEESQPTDDYIEEMRAAGISPDERLYLPGRKWHSQRTLSRIIPALLPTPQAADGLGGRLERNPQTIATGKRPSGTKASLSLASALDRVEESSSSGASMPPPSSDGKNSSAGLRLSPCFVEWMMGAPPRWTDPDCPLSATEFSSRPVGSWEPG
jgi:hypothetical protein